jgi:hypothetical protein
LDFSYLTVLPRGRQVWDYVVFPRAEFDDRKEKLAQVMDEKGVDGLLVYSDGLSRRYVSYLTNYCNSVSWSASVCIITRDLDPIIISSMAPRDITYNKKSLPPKLELNAVGLGMISNHRVAAKTIEYLKEHNMMDRKYGGVNLPSLNDFGLVPFEETFPDMPDCTERFDGVLEIKSDAEIFAITQAASIAKKAASDYLRLTVPGTDEREIAARVDRLMRVYGVDNIALLVSAGKGEVELHQPRDYIIQEGDTVSVHVDILYLHYNGMFGSTLYRGEPNADRKEYFSGFEKKYRNILNGISCAKSLQGVSKVMENGYVLAQGIGADTAEAPYGENTALGSGSVFTLSFCENRHNFGGLFLCDTFVFREDGVHSMGSAGLDKISYL